MESLEHIKPNLSGLNITIVGMGLIGGSFAKALKKLEPKNLWGVDIDENVNEFCRIHSIVDKGFADPKIPISQSDIVILCLYPNHIIKFFKENLKHFKSGVIITDVSGNKSGIIEQIEGILPNDLEFIGGHPMAGTEKSGIEYSSSKLFEGNNYILTPSKRNRECKISFIEWILETLGAKVIRTEAKKHDELIAITSQLPHIIAASLIQCGKMNIGINSFVGGSFRDATRVADINSKLWSELLINNSESLINQIDIFENQIQIFKKIIAEKQKDKLELLFEDTKTERRFLV